MSSYSSITLHFPSYSKIYDALKTEEPNNHDNQNFIETIAKFFADEQLSADEAKMRFGLIAIENENCQTDNPISLFLQSSKCNGYYNKITELAKNISNHSPT